MPPIPCACGCGTLIPPINKCGVAARFAHGHNARTETIGQRFSKGQMPWNKGKPYPVASLTHKGVKHPKEATEKAIKTKLQRYGPSLMTPEGRRKVSQAISNHSMPIEERQRRSEAMRGKKNHFYGKRHPPEVIELLRIAHTGTRSANWRGGTGCAPYGVGFTKPFKRLIRERDSNKCQHCGKTPKQNGRNLPIHHIDHNKDHNDPTNLITVCDSCNLWLSWHRDDPVDFFPRRRLMLI